MLIICVFVSCVFHAFAYVHCCLVVTCWETADLLTLVGDVCYFTMWYPGSGVVLDCIVFFAVFLTLLRQALTKMKISAHKLETENGIYNKITREQGICKICSLEVEDELHFLITCQKLSQGLSVFDGEERSGCHTQTNM